MDSNENTVIWQFREVYKNTFDNKDAGNPDTLFVVDLMLPGSNVRHGCSMKRKEIEPLLGYFNVQKPEDLVGKSFTGKRTDSRWAMNYLLLQIKHGGNYKPPTKEQLYERMAVALSKMECPNFSNVDDETLANAFSDIFSGWNIREDWLRKFTDRILELSKNKVILQKANIEIFKCRIRGPAEYMILTDGNMEQKLILGPYINPINFED